MHARTVVSMAAVALLAATSLVACSSDGANTDNDISPSEMSTLMPEGTSDPMTPSSDASMSPMPSTSDMSTTPTGS